MCAECHDIVCSASIAGLDLFQNIHRWLPVGMPASCECKYRLPFVKASLAGFCTDFGSASLCLPFGFAVNFASLIPTFSLHSGFAFICPFGLTFRFPQSFAFGFTFHFVQASPSVPVFKSSVPSDFASLENLSRLHSVPSFRLSCSLRSHANRLRLIHPDLKDTSL